MSELLAVLGPTASSKSAVALRLAERLGGLILSVDSMQVYRGMDIGTAKPSAKERARVPHLMIDLVEPEEEYSVADFQATARHHLATARRPVIIAGGSGLHFRAVVDPLEFPPTDPDLRARLEAADPDRLRSELETADPDAAHHVDLDNPRRVIRAVEIFRLTGLTPSLRARTPAARAVADYTPLLPFRAVGIDPGDELPERIRTRLQQMRQAGLTDEVRRLAPRLGRTAAQAVGYKELLPAVRGGISEDEGYRNAEANTLTLARSQRTYFRRDPRIRWVTWEDDPEQLAKRVGAALELEA